MTGPSKSTVRAAAWVLGAAIAVQGLVAWWYLVDDPYASQYVADAQSYDEWALRLTGPDRGAEPVFHQPPLFPVLLALVYASFNPAWHHVAALAFVGLLNAAALALLVPIGRVWFGSVRAGWLAAFLLLLYGPLVFYGLKLLPVSLALLSQGAAVLALGVARRRPSFAAAAATGAAWGVAALVRAEMLLFVPIAVAAVAFPPTADRRTAKRRTALAGTVLAGWVVLLLPAVVHNASRGDFVLVASSSGENLYIGNQRGATGSYKALVPEASDIFSQRLAATAIPERELGRRLLPSEVSRYWRDRAVSEVLQDPLGWLVLEGRKLLLILHPADPPEIYSFSLERELFLLPLWALPLGAWTLFLLGAAGLLAAWRERLRDRWPLVALLALHVVVLLVFFVDGRLRLPMLYFLGPFGGLAIETGIRRWREGHRRTVAAVTVLAVLATSVSAMATRPNARDRRRAASVLSIQGRLDESLAVLRPELARRDADVLAIELAGFVFEKKGDFVQAREQYERALASGGLVPQRAHQTRTRLATVLERMGDYSGAMAAHDTAVSNRWANANTYFQRGLFRLHRGDRAGASRDFQHAARLDPAWPEPRAALRSLLGAVPPPG